MQDKTDVLFIVGSVWTAAWFLSADTNSLVFALISLAMFIVMMLEMRR